jgi:phage-related holin
MERTLNFLSLYTGNIATGFAATVAGYFAPVKGMSIVMLSAIVIDLVSGVWAAIVKHQPIQSKKLWRTAYKILFAFIIVNLMHSIDQEMGISGITIARIVALFITGFEVWSIIENAAVITDHPIFKALQKYMRTEVKEKTGIDMNENPQ